MSKGWSEERKRRQAEMIRKHKPWEKSTGPKSDAGKAVSSQNAVKHGLYGVDGQTIEQLLKLNAEFVRLYKQLHDYDALVHALERTDRKYNEIKGKAPRPPSIGGTE